MRRSAFGSVSAQRQSVLKPRNTDITPNSRLSSGLKNKKRVSSEGNVRLSQLGNRYTPTRSNIPKYTPVRSHGSSNTLVPPAPPSASRSSVDSTRSSSMGGRNRKDNRPIGDSSFKAECVDKIMEFLLSSGYEYEITRRQLLNPSTKDFTQVFTFIYRHFNPSYNLPHKFEEEIPRLMKRLLYPSSLSKSTFISVGSRHTWPTILAMMAWMIDVLSIYNNTDPFSAAFPNDFCVETTVKHKRIEKFFDIYKCGDNDDEVMKYKEDYRHIIEELFEVRPQDIISLQEFNEKLDEEISIASSSGEKLEQLELQYEQLVNDKVKMERYKEEIQVHVTAMETEKAELEFRYEEQRAEVNKLHEEQLRLEAIKEKQALSAGELARFKNHAKDVAVLITQLQAQGKEMDSQIWSLEMTLGKAQNEVTEKISSFNSLVHELELGEGLIIESSSIADNIQHWKQELVGSLYECKKNTKHVSYETQNKKMRKEEELSVVEESLKEKKGEVEKYENKLRRLEEDIVLTKNEILAEEQEIQQENERLRQQTVEARKGHKALLYQKQCSVDDAKKDLESTKAYGMQRMRSGAEFLIKVCDATLDDLEFKRNAALQFKDDVTKICKDLLEVVRNKTLLE